MFLILSCANNMAEEAGNGLRPSMGVTVVLASEGEEAVKNQSCSIFTLLKPDTKLSASLFCREMIENSAAFLFLLPVVNRIMTEDPETVTAVELVYGNGVRTIVQRARFKGKFV